MPAACSIQCWEERKGPANAKSAGPDAWIDLRAALWGASTSNRVMMMSKSRSRFSWPSLRLAARFNTSSSMARSRAAMMSLLVVKAPRSSDSGRFAPSAMSSRLTSAQLFLAAHSSAAARQRPSLVS